MFGVRRHRVVGRIPAWTFRIWLLGSHSGVRVRWEKCWGVRQWLLKNIKRVRGVKKRVIKDRKGNKKVHTISHLEFVVTRSWYSFIINMCFICRLKVNYERPIKQIWVKDEKWDPNNALDNSLWITEIILLCYLSVWCQVRCLPLKFENKSEENVHWITACCLEQDGCSTKISTMALSLPIK